MALPLHYNKTGYKDFDNYQRVAIIILYIKSKHSLREFLEDDLKTSLWKHWLQLKRIPAKSTLHDWIKLFNLKTIRLICKQLTDNISPTLTAIDATGLDSHQRSRHYGKRLKDFQGVNFPHLPYAKLDLWIDVETKIILDFNLVLKPRHDVIAAKKIFRRNSLKRITTLGDGAYDCEELHNIAHERGGKHFAPVRKFKFKHKMKGKFRRKCLEIPDYYGMRSIVECVNSMLKRTQITALRSRKAHMKKKELGWHVVLHNIKRMNVFRIFLFTILKEKFIGIYFLFNLFKDFFTKSQTYTT